MRVNFPAARALLLVALATVAACQDAPVPLGPPDDAQLSRGPAGRPEVGPMFARASPEVMALPQTVFSAVDSRTGIMVFGVEHPAATRGVQTVLARLGVPAAAYRIEVTEPIHFMSDNLRSEHRPVVAGVQLHWSQYVCTLGFSADHSGGRSMITNSHCTDNQGSTGSTQYNQPSRTASPNAIAVEAHDPAYFRGGVCPRGKVCRYSDAARALYQPGVESQARIARTTGVNSGSLQVNGHWSITSQDNTTTSFTSGTFNKVGRTTGWTQGGIAYTCMNVNVSGSNIHMLCQTAVNAGVGGGDSGSPVFRITGTNAAQLVGILWGGSSSGQTFVFSPFQAIQQELGNLNAMTDGVGGGGSQPPPDDDNGGGGGGNCPPGNPNHPRCNRG